MMKHKPGDCDKRKTGFGWREDLGWPAAIDETERLGRTAIHALFRYPQEIRYLPSLL
jgi:hypothetical protein